MALQKLPPFEPELEERVLWTERRPRPLASFVRHPVGVVLGLGCLSIALRVVRDPSRFEASLSWSAVLSGLMALGVIVVLGQVLISYLRHANAEVVFTDRRVLWREAGRTRQVTWGAVVAVEHHPQALILCTSEPYQDEVVGAIAQAFVSAADPKRLVCPIAEPARVWEDLRSQGVVDQDLVERLERERPPFGPAAKWLVMGLALSAGALALLAELRGRLGGWALALGLPLLALGLGCLVVPIRWAHTLWTQPDDPDA